MADEYNHASNVSARLAAELAPDSGRGPGLGPALILDGAMGTELERRGLRASLPLWSAHALVDAPEVVRAIHSDYAGGIGAAHAQ